jgi:hypothetical protein
VHFFWKEAIMYCQYCGSQIEDDANRCIYCGRDLNTRDSLYGQEPSLRPSHSAAKVTLIYSIVFGGIALPGLVSSTDMMAISLIIVFALISLGIIGIIKMRLKPGSEKGFMVALAIIYGIFQAVGILVLISDPFYFLVYEAMIITPIISSIIYFKQGSKKPSKDV